MSNKQKKTETEVIERVLDFAEKNESIRAVIRTNLLPKRKYEYYNFCFVADDPEQYDGDIFENCFGERILLYRGGRNYPELFPDNTKAHLMVFTDGTTIAINVMGKEAFLARYNREQTHENVWIGDTYLKILDKDHILPEIERLDEKQTWFSGMPSEEEFDGTNSEFWWVLKTFAEYTLREELPSAMFYLNAAVRDLLNRMIRWSCKRDSRSIWASWTATWKNCSAESCSPFIKRLIRQRIMSRSGRHSTLS